MKAQAQMRKGLPDAASCRKYKAHFFPGLALYSVFVPSRVR